MIVIEVLSSEKAFSKCFGGAKCQKFLGKGPLVIEGGGGLQPQDLPAARSRGTPMAMRIFS